MYWHIHYEETDEGKEGPVLQSKWKTHIVSSSSGVIIGRIDEEYKGDKSKLNIRTTKYVHRNHIEVLDVSKHNVTIKLIGAENPAFIFAWEVVNEKQVNFVMEKMKLNNEYKIEWGTWVQLGGGKGDYIYAAFDVDKYVRIVFCKNNCFDSLYPDFLFLENVNDIKILSTGSSVGAGTLSNEQEACLKLRKYFKSKGCYNSLAGDEITVIDVKNFLQKEVVVKINELITNDGNIESFLSAVNQHYQQVKATSKKLGINIEKDGYIKSYIETLNGKGFEELIKLKP